MSRMRVCTHCMDMAYPENGTVIRGKFICNTCLDYCSGYRHDGDESEEEPVNIKEVFESKGHIQRGF